MADDLKMLARKPGDKAHCSGCGGEEFEATDGRRGPVRSCTGSGSIGHFGETGSHLSEAVKCVGCGAVVGRFVTNTDERIPPSRNIGGG